jgi:hypothetical protein
METRKTLSSIRAETPEQLTSNTKSQALDFRSCGNSLWSALLRDGEYSPGALPVKYLDLHETDVVHEFFAISGIAGS